MAAGILKKSLCALATLATVTATVVTLHPERAEAGFFDWFNQDPEPQPPPYYPPDYYPQPKKKKKPSNGQEIPMPGDGTIIVDGQPNDGGGELDAAKQALAEFRNQPGIDYPFIIVRKDWTPEDEVQFAKFVNQLGKAISDKKCRTVKSCMRSREANMYADFDAPSLILYSDCADFPYFLRSYFAYHNGLPFAYVNGVRMNQKPVASLNDLDASLASKHEDTSPYGNTIVSRGGSNTAKDAGWEPNYIGYVSRLFDSISTRTFRVSPLTANYNMADIYPVKLNREGIGPGTLVHTTGHLMVVWDVDSKGVIQTIDAHPDGSVQFKVVQPSTLDRSRPDQGLGFFRFRSMHLNGAHLSPNGAYYGGKVSTDSDQDLYNAGLWSLEQWYGPGSTIAPGTKVDPSAYKTAFVKQNFFDYLTEQMRDRSAVFRADDLVADVYQRLCSDIQQRQYTVAEAIKANIPSQPHPSTLPSDIFGEADPTWGALSSPGSDSRLRGTVRDVIRTAISQFRAAKSGDPTVRFDGTADEYVAAIRARLDSVSKACVIQYKNSSGSTVKMTMVEAIARFDKISFDPYDCIEKRWGATGQELSTCVDRDSKGVWYKAEQPMRNVLGKTTETNVPSVRSTSPITLDMLRDPSLIDRPDSSAVNLGLARPPIVNLDANFASPKFIDLLTK